MAPLLPMTAGFRPGISVFMLLVLTPLLFPACTDPMARENDRLRKEITLVHDAAMAQIGSLYELQKQLKATTGCSRECESRVTMLRQADEAMFSWMRQYRPLAVESDLVEDNRYRREQLEQIRSVQKVMEDAVQQAREYLQREG